MTAHETSINDTFQPKVSWKQEDCISNGYQKPIMLK